MDHLDEISVEELQDALDNVEQKKPTERFLAAIAYKNGVSQAELAEWYDVQRRTIYNWLKLLLMIIAPGETEKSQNYSKKNSKKLSTNHLKRSVSTRRRGRRRSSSSFSTTRTVLSTHSQAAGDC